VVFNIFHAQAVNMRAMDEELEITVGDVQYLLLPNQQVAPTCGKAQLLPNKILL
jgi:hypothetical protein